MKQYCVYIHKNKINNKVYVGITSQKPVYRWKNGKGYPQSTQLKMYNAIKKYGWDNFEHIIVAEALTYEEATRLEQDLILKYDSFLNGYNMSLGGDGNKGHVISDELRQQMKLTHQVPHPGAKGKTFSEEHKKHLSEARRGKKMKPHTAETKKKISNALSGKIVSEETRKKMSEAAKGRKVWNKGLVGIKGHKQTEETRQKIAEKNGYNVAAYDPITNILQYTFTSITEAAKYLREETQYKKANRNMLANCIKLEKIYCGFMWYIIKD